MKKISLMLLMALFICSVQMVHAQNYPTQPKTHMDSVKMKKEEAMKSQWMKRNQMGQTQTATDTTRRAAVIPGGGVKHGQTIGHVGATGYKHHHKYHRHHAAVSKAKHPANKPTSPGTEKKPNP